MTVSDDRQFEELLRTYQDKVFRLCCAMLGDRGLAQEAAQESFVRIWKGLGKFRGESSVSTWIYAIARNTCLTALKSRPESRNLSMELPGVRASAERAAAGSQGPDRRPDVMQLVAELPENYRQVVLLYHMEEKSYDEVALMLGMPLGTVKTYLHRARKQMAESLMAAEAVKMAERGS